MHVSNLGLILRENAAYVVWYVLHWQESVFENTFS